MQWLLHDELLYYFLISAAGVFISTPHSFLGKPLNPQIKPELAERTLTTWPSTSIPCELFAVVTQRTIGFCTFSPFGAYAELPNSMTRPMRLVSESAFVFPQIDAKEGFVLGATDGTSSLLKTNDHHSTAPSSISTVGPVIAAFQVDAPGAAWK